MGCGFWTKFLSKIQFSSYSILSTLGEWDKSLEIAENHDRISLKTTYYKIAKQYEVSKDFDRAIEYYEKSETHTKEVPRMLMNNGELQYLQRYVEESQHKGLYSWWA